MYAVIWINFMLRLYHDTSGQSPGKQILSQGNMCVIYGEQSGGTSDFPPSNFAAIVLKYFYLNTAVIRRTSGRKM